MEPRRWLVSLTGLLYGIFNGCPDRPLLARRPPAPPLWLKAHVLLAPLAVFGVRACCAATRRPIKAARGPGARPASHALGLRSARPDGTWSGRRAGATRARRRVARGLGVLFVLGCVLSRRRTPADTGRMMRKD